VRVGKVGWKLLDSIAATDDGVHSGDLLADLVSDVSGGSVGVGVDSGQPSVVFDGCRTVAL
jgi:hypothetical protein